MNSTEIIKLINLNYLKGSRVIIDCGHVPLELNNERNIIKANSSQLETLEIGINLFNKLKESKEVIIGICLADVKDYISKKETKGFAKKFLLENKLDKLLPNEFLEMFKRYDVSLQSIKVTLQTQNTNKFSNLIKKIKKKSHTQTTSDIYKTYNLLLLDNEENFGLTSPFLLNSKEEIKALNGDWWKEEHYYISTNDTLLAPLLRVKKLQCINLYDKNIGTLCPATYGGLLLNFITEDTDYISIYSRDDDEFITEKMARGIIATHLLMPKCNSNHIGVILTDHEEPEIFYLNKNRIIDRNTAFCDFVEQYQDTTLPLIYSNYGS